MQNDIEFLAEFHPQTELRDWGNGQAFRLADALTGVCVFGATGSGKTSGPAKHLAYGYLAADFGGLVLCAKKEERRQWQQWAADCGRTDDLIIIDSTGKWRFNFLEWEASRPDASGGLTINIVAILDEIAGAIARSAGKAENGGGDNKFWEDALHQMNANLVDLPIFAGVQVSLPLMRSIVTSAPQSLEQVFDPKWQETSICARTLAQADKATMKASADVRDDFEQCRDYWLLEYPLLSEKPRSIITLSFSMLVRPLITRPLRKLFSTDTNVKPEDAFDGKIIIRATERAAKGLVRLGGNERDICLDGLRFDIVEDVLDFMGVPADEERRKHFRHLLQMASATNPDPDRIEDRLRKIDSELGRMFN